jgi:two-component system nitrate/nitrite response regulator NarL
MANGERVIRVGVIDDDAMLREGMTVWFSARPDLQLVASAGSLDAFLIPPPTLDVVMLDLNLRDFSDPADNVRRLVVAGYRVLIVSTIPDAEHVVATIGAGALGYVLKNRDLAALASAIHEVASGEFALSPELAFVLARDSRSTRSLLTPREREVLGFYASGMTLEAVARRVGIAPGTARTHLARVKQKYADAGRPAYTKLELADRHREDSLSLDGLPPHLGAPEA